MIKDMNKSSRSYTRRHMRSHSVYACNYPTQVSEHLNRSHTPKPVLNNLPRRDERLSWPSWLGTYRHGLPISRQSPDCVSPCRLGMAAARRARRGVDGRRATTCVACCQQRKGITILLVTYANMSRNSRHSEYGFEINSNIKIPPSQFSVFWHLTKEI